MTKLEKTGLITSIMLAALLTGGIVYQLTRPEPTPIAEQVEQVDDKHEAKIRELEEKLDVLSSALARTQERVRAAEQSVAKKKQELRDAPKPSGLSAADQIERFQKLRP